MYVRVSAARWTMMGNMDRRSLSLVELFRRARLAEQARRGDAVPAPTDDRSTAREEVVSPRDERGTRYPGDFPNDLGRHYRGCF
jgi:hypothetical protein